MTVTGLLSRGFLASSLSTYDLFTLYTSLPHIRIKENPTELIEQTFNKEGSLYLALLQLLKNMLSSTVKRYMRDLVNTFFGLSKIQVILDKLKARDFNATSLSAYDLFYSLHYCTS